MRVFFLMGMIFLMTPLAPTQAQLNTSEDLDITDLKGQAKADPYEVTQENLLKKLSEYAEVIKNGSTPEMLVLDPAELQHLAGSYLVCSLKKGTCPEVLDGILEIDFLNALRSRSNSCKNMKGFWGSWIKNEMEKKHQMYIKTGFMKKKEYFDKNQRSRYIRCSLTVKKMKQEFASAAAYVKKHRKSDTSSLVALLEEIKGTIPNVFKPKYY